jgi:hypothetical protein
MKLFAMHSPAFAPLWKPFRASVLNKTSFTLVEAEIPSRYDNCKYGEPVYLDMLQWLIEWRINLINTESEPFVTCGIDSEFYGDPVPMLEELASEYDLVGADDNPNGGHRLCSCFYLMSPHQLRLIALYNRVIHDPRFKNPAPDDEILNEFRNMVDWHPLPHNLFWNTLREYHTGDAIPQPPAEMLWAHANYTKGGVEAKVALLNSVREAMAKYGSSK